MQSIRDQIRRNGFPPVEIKHLHKRSEVRELNDGQHVVVLVYEDLEQTHEFTRYGSVELDAVNVQLLECFHGRLKDLVYVVHL